MVKKQTTEQVSYQSIRSELDSVLIRLQDPASDVDDAVALYEQAVQLAAKLDAHLESAENHIKKVSVDFGITALDDDATDVLDEVEK